VEVNPILLKNFTDAKTVSGIRKITNNEIELRDYCSLSDIDNMILSDASSLHRRLEFLSVRALIKELKLDISIRYIKRKPIANKGYISITHSDTIAAIIWSPDTEYAIDIEEISDKLNRIKNRAFSDSELLFANNDPAKLGLLWNCKECVFKIIGINAVDFKNTIKVLPFAENEKIHCDFMQNNKKIASFEFNYMVFNEHTLTWGKKIS
jgi:phosphopantetheinyl transferase